MIPLSKHILSKLAEIEQHIQNDMCQRADQDINKVIPYRQGTKATNNENTPEYGVCLVEENEKKPFGSAHIILTGGDAKPSFHKTIGKLKEGVGKTTQCSNQKIIGNGVAIVSIKIV